MLKKQDKGAHPASNGAVCHPVVLSFALKTLRAMIEIVPKRN